ncbi:hypothetical protein V1511DRAFT_494305 [Dipodascopsis uninucleata]
MGPKKNNKGKNKSGICYFFQRGHCERGNNCSYQHVVEENEPRSRDSSDLETLSADLGNELREIVRNPPVYHLSSITLVKGSNKSLVANRDVSPEELRLRYYEASADNKLQLYTGVVTEAERSMKELFQYIDSNVERAIRFFNNLQVDKLNGSQKSFLTPKELNNPNAPGILAFKYLQGDYSVISILEHEINNKANTSPFISSSMPFGSTISNGQSKTASSFDDGFNDSQSKPSSTFGSTYEQKQNTAFGVSPFGALASSSQNQPGSVFGTNSSQSLPSSVSTDAHEGHSSPFGSVNTTSLNSSNTQNSFNTTVIPSFGSNTTFGSNLSGGKSIIPAFGSSTFGSKPARPEFGSHTFGSSPSIQSPFGSATTTASSMPVFGQSTFGQSSTLPNISSGSSFGQQAIDSSQTSFASLAKVSDSRNSPLAFTQTPNDTKQSQHQQSSFGHQANQEKPFASFSSNATTSPFGSILNKQPSNILSQSPFGSFAGNSSPFSINSKNEQSPSMPFSSSTKPTLGSLNTFPPESPFSSSMHNGPIFSASSVESQNTIPLPMSKPTNAFGSFASLPLSTNSLDDSNQMAEETKSSSASSISLDTPPAHISRQQQQSREDNVKEAKNRNLVHSVDGSNRKRFPVPLRISHDEKLPGLPPRPLTLIERAIEIFEEIGRPVLNKGQTNQNGHHAFISSGATPTFLPDVNDLTIEEKTAFESTTFELGRVPEIEPPFMYL